jgi:hypothetical protein
MPEEQHPDFHDPVLKTVVKRAWGEQCCPHALRDQISRAISGSRPSKRSMPLWLVCGLAAAAVAALAVAPSIIHRLNHSSDTVDQIALAPPAAFPVSLQTDLIHTHDRCSKSKDHQHLPGISRDDDSAIALALRTQLSRAVLVARPADPAWTFTGAAVCHVGTIPCGHLVFINGSESLSIFSLPHSADPELADGAAVQTVTDGHPMIAFARNGALFCLVANGPEGSITLNDLSHMYDRMASHVTTAAPPPNPVAELLYPVQP